MAKAIRFCKNTFPFPLLHSVFNCLFDLHSTPRRCITKAADFCGGVFRGTSFIEGFCEAPYEVGLDKVRKAIMCISQGNGSERNERLNSESK